MKTLTNLEKCAILKKAGIIDWLNDGKDIHVKQMDYLYDPEISPEGKWDNRESHGEGILAFDYIGYYGETKISRVSLSEKKFVLMEKEQIYMDGSSNSQPFHPHDCGCCGTFYYLFPSNGQEIDRQVINIKELLELVRENDCHCKEAIAMAIKEIGNR